MFLIALACGCDARTSSSGGGGSGGDDEKPDPVAMARDVDKMAADDLAKSKLDAKQWLASEKHGTFEARKSDILQFTNDVLAAGAVGVFVSEPEELEGGTQLIDHIYIQLPTDAAARQKIIELYNRKNEGEQDPEKDVGQKYLVHDWG
jgi:hypothetical protein